MMRWLPQHTVTQLVAAVRRVIREVPGAAEAAAAGLLALVAGQDVEPAEGSDGTDGRWRIARRAAPDRVVSVTDPDARHIHKNRTRHQDGFKAHVAFEPETGLFTAVELAKGTVQGPVRRSSHQR